MMPRPFKDSISNKLMLVVMATTFITLLVYGSIMLVFDLRGYHEELINDVRTQASIVADVSAPALEFNDPQTASQHLGLLRTRPVIIHAALLTPSGERFAEYISARSTREEEPIAWPSRNNRVAGYVIEGNRLEVWQPLVKDGQILGSVYISARYELSNRLVNYVLILVGVMAASLGFALFIATWLRGALTGPIFAVTDIARQVMQTRDFALRAEKHSEDEIGVLVDAFNDMLREIERRAKALEASNHSLEHEMSERQAAERALRIADRRKDEFLATLAHELRNPLAPLANGLRILRLPGQMSPEQQTALVVMERQLKQMVRLVDDLLDVSRITTGKLTITKSLVDLQSIMQSAIETSGLFIEELGHDLEVDMPARPICIDADPVRLAQVFSNLLNNAAKYTPRGGKIRFSARVENGQAIIDVVDNGIGIEAEMLAEIFGMFIQVDQSLERDQAGLGVGLALSKRLVELHGGNLLVGSAGHSLGSTFTVVVDVEHENADAGDPRASSPKTRVEPCRVLLVDDNVDFVTSLKTLLTHSGHEVRLAHSGADALAMAGEYVPDIAFLDIGMPGMNGYDLARALRQLPELAHCTLVAVTGWGQEKDRQLSKEAGFDHHLLKPASLEDIKALIEFGSVAT
ncbi:hybrid sensor histidine kinase/response regulator [Allohahella marinimesophila]|uniref:histidine kinase n=1 Tax=Allohahella marinimesophila TaxID=1054972 RepID=A0ABP7PI63_9GAMM